MSKQVVTFGCRLNAFESQVMQTQLDELALKEDIVVFNSCAVTKEAERQLRQSIRKAKRQHPEKKIIVTGCAAQINPEHYANMPEVSQVLGNQEKLDLANYLKTPKDMFAHKVHVTDIMQIQETANHLVTSYDEHTRAFVQIQNGCNHRCTFCIIPYGRGNNRSVPIGHITEHVKKLVEQGYQEIVFTGVDISDYGKDLPGAPTLGEMIQRVLKLVPQLKRLRLSSIDVAEIDDTLFGLISYEPRLMPHLHISLQAGDNMILKRMKRRHMREDVLIFCDKVRSLRKDIAFGADIIAGFPTESDAMFENSLKLIKEADLQFLHVFPYSERDGTPAAKMPQVPVAIRKERAALLRQEGEANLRSFLKKYINTMQRVIIEKNDIARAENFIEIKLNTPSNTGEVLEVKVTGVDNLQAIGEIV